MPDYPDIRRARRLRQEANTPERKAWEILRLLRKEGHAVRRQAPIAGLTVDFAIRSLRLVIEMVNSNHEVSLSGGVGVSQSAGGVSNGNGS